MYMVRDILDLHSVGGQGVRASEEFPGRSCEGIGGEAREFSWDSLSLFTSWGTATLNLNQVEPFRSKDLFCWHVTAAGYSRLAEIPGIPKWEPGLGQSRVLHCHCQSCGTAWQRSPVPGKGSGFISVPDVDVSSWDRQPLKILVTKQLRFLRASEETLHLKLSLDWFLLYTGPNHFNHFQAVSTVAH